MATSLAAQLAQIAANSKTTLNVKYQKAAHSKSLIFEPRVAAGQSYKTIYDICIEGYDALCLLDGRFSQFNTTLFSEQSQDEDRTEMTAAENAELDKRIEAFLHLVGSRLRLMPAIKAVEWLIRRFRIHEFNTQTLITTFLPYHTIPAFVTLMSILPSKIPQVYKFLDPYIRSLTAPPRAATVHQASSHYDVLSTISAYTIQSCRNQQHYPALISFWAGVMTESVNGMLDKARSGRRTVQLDNDQKIYQQVMPILSETLAMRRVPDLQIASYMITAVWVAKADLDDVPISLLMEAVVQSWTSETLRPGLVCLSILAQYRSAKQLSGKITKVLLKVQNLPQLLAEIAQSHRVDKLANGLAIALKERFVKKGDMRSLPIIKSMLLAQILQDSQAKVIFKSLLVAGHQIRDDVDEKGEIRKQLGQTLMSLAQSTGDIGAIVQQAIEEEDFDIETLELQLGASVRLRPAIVDAGEDVAMKEDGPAAAHAQPQEELPAALERLSLQKSSRQSCLAAGSETLFSELCYLFILNAANSTDLLTINKSPLLLRGDAIAESFYFSFYARLWTGPYPTLARIAALEMAKDRMKLEDCADVDFQAIIPYCIAGLADPAKKVRRAAADLLAVLGALYPRERAKIARKPRWGEGQLYQTTESMEWMTIEALTSFIQVVLLPALEESILDQDHISAVLKDALDGSHKDTEKDKKNHLSHTVRLSILTSLASHVVLTPVMTVKVRLLKPLNQVRGVSSTSRTQLLLPVLKWWATLTEAQAHELLAVEAVDEALVDRSCVEIMVPNDADGLDTFFGLIADPAIGQRSNLLHCVFERIRKMWPSMKGEMKYNTAAKMLDLAHPASRKAVTPPAVVAEEAADLLRNVDLTTKILHHFLGSLQVLAKIATDAPPSKRRRVSSSEHNRGVGLQAAPDLDLALSKITFVLQLVESSNPVEHPELLQNLFMTLSDLQLLRSLVGSELGYLQNLVLSSLLAMMPAYKDNKELEIDTSVGHGDVLVTCIQKSSSPAVQNTALLLVASLARTAPEVVLHSVMPIFTFMGNSVLLQSDDYSAHVINQTIKEVVPPLIETFRKGKRNVVASAADLLSSFITAYEHIPSHRKYDLFISLVENLGPAEFLYALVAMLVDKYGITDNILAFASEIMSHFAVEIQLESLTKLIDLIGDIFKPKPTLSATLFGKSGDVQEDLQKAALKELTLLPRLLSNRKLKVEVSKYRGRDDMEASRTSELYSNLLEEILKLADVVKSHKALHNRCGDALSSLLNLLSIGEFIKVVETLLDRPNIGLRQKVLRCLEVRVDHERNTDPASREALLTFLPQLTSVIQESDDIHYKHTAVACVDKIAEKYGKKDPEAVAAAASTIAGDRCLGQDDERLRVMALLCLASLVDVLQDGIVSVLPIAIPKALSYLQQSLEGEKHDTELHNASYAFMTSLVHHLPYLLSGSYLDQLLACSNASAEASLDADAVDGRVQCLRFLAKQIDANTMFPAMDQNWKSASEAGFTAIAEFVDILGLTIDKHPKSAVAKNVAPLSSIIFNVFDVRRQKLSEGGADETVTAKISSVEKSVYPVALKMIYKLNDTSFRPVFAKLMEWSTTGLPKSDVTGRIMRQQSVYGFLAIFFDTLKSIVTSYATYVVDNAVKILNESEPKKSDSKELWKRVLTTLAKCFMHDQDGFWQAPSHFGAIAPVLAQQFLHAASLDASEELIPAFVELAAAADSQEHQKELNSMLLKHLRSEQPEVRLAAVKCEQALTDRLGEEWLALLPEMLPYISELQDDDDEVVDRETHRWIVKIEGVLGESLDVMLQ